MDKTASLTPEIQHIVLDKGTERPFSGKHQTVLTHGSYLCRRCGFALFRGDSQFTSHCGWPSFDDQIAGTIKETPDIDGRRTEILCARCAAHLGHVFEGERITAKNRRHCVNSLAIEFVPSLSVIDTEEAIFAGGCFWGVEALLKQIDGVLLTEVGYTGGDTLNPTYQQVCTGRTGHYEAIRIVFDTAQLDYETLLKHFFEIHDPTQVDGQGPDRAPQYRSAVFVFNEQQARITRDVIQVLINLGYDIATVCLPVNIFWPAEDYHQDYYAKTGKQPYCHARVKRFKA